MDVALFVTCLADTLFPAAGQATVTVLERLGCQVSFPTDQTCCGQMHMNSGYAKDAGAMVRSFAKTFADADAVVIPSGSCAAMLVHHAETVAPGTKMPPIYEFTQFITDVIGTTDVGAVFPHTVTYHSACHSLRLMNLGDRPIRLLQGVQGLTYIPLPDADRCCGFGGTFSMKEADVSNAMGNDKVDNVLSTKAEYLATVDVSCTLHQEGIAQKRGTSIHPIHLAEILASKS